MNMSATMRSGIAILVVLIRSAVGDEAIINSYIDEGFTEPEKTVHVAASDVGVLAIVSVREGERVRAGAPICSLETHVLTAALRAAEIRLASQGKIAAAQAKLRFRENHLDQIAALREKTHASNLEVTDAELEVSLAEADLQSALDDRRGIEMEILKIQAQINQRRIVAPIDGIILEIPKQVGEAVTSSDSHVATIVNLDRLRVRYFLTTESALALSVGQIVRVSFPAMGRSADATVDFISPITDANSGTVRVELMLDNADDQYRAGLRCVIEETELTSEPLWQAENPYRVSPQPRR